MDGLLFNLLWSCGRQAELGHHPNKKGKGDSFEDVTAFLTAADVLVNNPAGETGSSTTQSETSIAHNPVTGIYCSAFNDSWEFYGGGGGLTGFARSLDGGVSWQDRGAVDGTAYGDPSLAWRRADGYFYLATLHSGGGLAVWRSTDDCGDFSLVSIPTTGGDDKEILIADNNPASLNYGNLYLVWTDFGVSGTPIRAIRSTNGGLTWSSPFNLSAAGVVQGAWPAVAPNGDVFVAWLRYASWPTGNISIEMARSTNGGVSYSAVTSPLTSAVSPRDATASSACGRPALNGYIRYLASPQMAVDGNGVLHVVYSQDPDTFNSGDVVNVYYRRSTNSGSSWSTPIQLNDVSTGDQYFPTIQANGLKVVAGWYDRRNDGANLRQDYYKRVSTDGGVTWAANERVSDVNSPIYLDPGLATCYHGDYDQSVVTATEHVVQWADDRNFVGSRNDPDVWTDKVVDSPPPPPISDTFSSAGALNGRVAETGSVSWTASPAATVEGGRVIDGAAVAGVPFNPAILGGNPTVAVTADIDPTLSSWIGVGFADQATGPYWIAGKLWALVSSTGFQVFTPAGVGAYGSIPGTPVNGFHQVKVQYTPSTLQAVVSINGVQVFSQTLASAPNIQYAGFHFYQSAEGGGRLDNFQVSSQGVPVISDTFSGSGVVNGRLAEVGGVSWTARPGAVIGTGVVLDGAAVGGVPFNPASLTGNPTVAVTADVDPLASTWVGVGFADQATAPYWIAGKLWALVSSTTYQVFTPVGVGATGSIPGTPVNGFHRILVRYTPATLQATVSINGVQVYSQTLASAPDIHYAGFHMYIAAEGGGKLDNFKVYSTSNP